MRRISVYILAIALVAAAAGAAGWVHIGHELSSVRERLSQTQARLAELDRQQARAERKLTNLREKGYVPRDTFATQAQAARKATVLIENGEGERIGTGFFVAADGVIATARHVVEASSATPPLYVRLQNGTVHEVSVAGMHDQADAALVTISGTGYPTVPLGYYENVEVGEEVGVVGFSEGFRLPLLHHGVVSAKGAGTSGGRLFTINSFVNKGNSGGPVFSNENDRVIGLVSARQFSVPEEKRINTKNVSSGLRVGNVDPLRLSVRLYNDMLVTVGRISQLGVGVVHPADAVRELLQRHRAQ